MRRLANLPPVVWIAALSVVFLLVVMLMSTPAKVSFDDYTPSPAPAFSAKTLDGKPVSLETLRGKVVLLNFWASWCGPCQSEFPDLIALQNKYKDKDFTVLGMAWSDTEPNIRTMVKNRGLIYPNVMVSPEMGEAFGGLAAIPVTLLMDQKGTIVYGYEGIDPSEKPFVKFDKRIASLLAK